MYVFLLVDVQPGEERKVLSSLKNIEEVKETSIVFGQYDLIIKVKNDTRDDIMNLINREIRTIDGVRGTLTLMPIHGFER
ncbi:MAG: Lrp/AsnC ligand binding domain-containing protein [Thermoproteota archaeon]